MLCVVGVSVVSVVCSGCVSVVSVVCCQAEVSADYSFKGVLSSVV